MIVEHQITSLVEEFKIPYKDPYCPDDWKDWYHYVLYDPKSNIRILINLCFNGKPETGYITDTFILTAPKGFIGQNIVNFKSEESIGYARNHQWAPGSLENIPLRFKNDAITFSINSYNTMFIRAKNDSLGINFCFQGCPDSKPIYVPERAPYGKGFIGWGVIPNYKISGELWVQNRCITITEDWYAYHDRNFGRFNWGNIGWTWFVSRVTDDEGNQWSYILHQSNTADHEKSGAPILFVHKNTLFQKIFIGDTITINTVWSKMHQKPKILPGAMASIFDNRSIKEPVKIELSAQDEKHTVRIQLYVKSFAELIVPDSESKAYTFMKEMSGSIQLNQNLTSKTVISNTGFFYGELVH